MGRVIEKTIVALACNHPQCQEQWQLFPVPATYHWAQHVNDLAEAVKGGWVLVLSPRLRSYCPEHRLNAVKCSCRRNNDHRRRYCLKHSPDARELIWSRECTPEDVQILLD